MHRLYAELAAWWPLLSPPAHYAEEAAELLPDLSDAAEGAAVTLLELGSGGGSLAWHLKKRFQLTLTDLSPEMLDVSRAVNPECEHLPGDMRTLDLGRTFDVVLIHDAVMYATDAASLRATLATAARHCRPGGGALFLPDCVRETFRPDSEHGGEDHSDGRALRYLEWWWDPDPADSEFEALFVLALRHRDGRLTVEQERHRFGLFSRAEWRAWLDAAGFEVSVRTDRWEREVFRCRRRAPSSRDDTAVP